jgi:hypothetical protein
MNCETRVSVPQLDREKHKWYAEEPQEGCGLRNLLLEQPFRNSLGYGLGQRYGLF